MLLAIDVGNTNAVFALFNGLMRTFAGSPRSTASERSLCSLTQAMARSPSTSSSQM